jgi:hypothetical protein
MDISNLIKYVKIVDGNQYLDFLEKIYTINDLVIYKLFLKYNISIFLSKNNIYLKVLKAVLLHHEGIF